MQENVHQLFGNRQWQRCIDLIESEKAALDTERERLTMLGISQMRLCRFDEAVRTFERLRPPYPPTAAINWAAILAGRNDIDHAIGILRQVNTSVRKTSLKALLELHSCFHFERILSVLNGSIPIGALPAYRPARLITLSSFVLLPLLTMMNTAGGILRKCGMPGGEKIQNCVASLRNQCWSHGMLKRPDFINGYIDLEKSAYFEESREVYKRTVIAYLEYWLQTGENINDFILSSVKPGDAHALYCSVRQERPETVLEVGTFTGFSTNMLAQAIKRNGKGRLHCVDPNIGLFSVKKPLAYAAHMLKTLQADDCVVIHEGFFSAPREAFDSPAPVLGTKIEQLIPKVDLAFIDGDHETVAMLQDFMLLLPHLNPQTTVLLHDIHTWYTVRQGVAAIFQDSVWKDQMKYCQFVPAGFDGVGVIKIDKRVPAQKEEDGMYEVGQIRT